MDYKQYIESRILGGETLDRALAYFRFRNHRIVFTNGCFDILHAGHIDYLSKAASLGDILLIGLNTDDSIRRLKGTSRPVNPEHSRALILASLRFVTAVVLFEEDTPENLIRLIQPDILVKGSDYKAEEIAGYDIVKAKGGDVVTLELLPGVSTSSLIERIRT